ncbi:MAG: hypothetical protein RJA66_716 [Actinomycetota bacterium]|jgi:hypothetical protein
MPEFFIVVGVAIVFLAAVLTPFRLPERKAPRRKRYRGGLGPALGAINEIFNPSAQKASIILEEKKIARKATPAAEDPLDKN